MHHKLAPAGRLLTKCNIGVCTHTPASSMLKHAQGRLVHEDIVHMVHEDVMHNMRTHEDVCMLPRTCTSTSVPIGSHR